jgi:GNAT superfamily N-acetyltransferase
VNEKDESLNYSVRVNEDLEADPLRKFFVQAYGDDTVFQDGSFLKSYFGQGLSITALSAQNEVVGHYGGLRSKLYLNGRSVPMIWGVNAFTLPEWRGRGINSKIIEKAIIAGEIFGVIGFTPKTAEFYDKLGFNMFQAERFRRYVINFSENTYEIAKLIGRDPEFVRSRLLVKGGNTATSGENDSDRLLEIHNGNATQFHFDFHPALSATTSRTREYLRHRFLAHPFISYRCIASREEDRILAFVMQQRERLYPTNYYVTRIIDLFGRPEALPSVLRAVLSEARRRQDLFVDFYCFGGLYNDILLNAGLSVFRDEEVGLVPQVSAPIQDRSNTYRIGLFSSRYKSEIMALQEDQVFFTRGDSDMDRINKVAQIQARESYE